MPMNLAHTTPAAPAGARRAITTGSFSGTPQARAERSAADGIVRREVLIQRTETGEPASGNHEADAPAGGQADPRNSHAHDDAHSGDEGAAAGDINLLANEVYGLIKRRLAHEAERMGRSR
ncbi:MAG TPA: hypothetical protein VFW40_01970 [Capsulimonadaceae bacterium]|nr:hypothetical protein [Capsulimonadaceae bacterium]